MVCVPSTSGRVIRLLALSGVLSACGHDAENAAQSARIAVLEEQVRRLTAADADAANKPAEAPKATETKKPFTIECPQPWLLHPPLGATLWNCKSPTPTPEGFYPHCSLVVQPQVAVELGTYFEYAWNASPQLHRVKALKDKPIKIKEHDAFEATYEAEPKPVAVKMRSVLIPSEEQVYAVTCFAPTNTFETYDTKAFQTITASIAFPDAAGK
jgi:hypothetical protein